MLIGNIVQFVENTISTICIVLLLTRNLIPRSTRKYWIGWSVFLMASAGILRLLNIPYGKFTTDGTYLVALIQFIVMIVFYKTRFKDIVGFWFVWINYSLCMWLILSISAIIEGVSLKTYGNAWGNIAMNDFNIVMFLLSSILFIWMTFIMKKKIDIFLPSRNSYILLAIILVVEYLFDAYGIGPFYGRINRNSISYILYLGIAFLAFVFMFFTLWSLSSRREEQLREKILQENYIHISDQYSKLQESFHDQRRLIHDVRNRQAALYTLLEARDIEGAKDFLKQEMHVAKAVQQVSYTQLTTVNFILNLKIREAEEKGISVITDVNLVYCPFGDPDIGVVIGNLMDNAMEAVQILPEQERRIWIALTSWQTLFLMVIRNPYTGKRIKKDGHYMTTKAEKSKHGLGLESVQMVVDQYDGEMMIRDDSHFFEVTIRVDDHKKKYE